MKKGIFLSILLLFGCAEVSLPDQYDAEYNRLHWAELTQGMSKYQVREIMGEPAWTERIQKDHDIYEAWFYLQEGIKIMTEKKYPKRNFIPIVMRDGILTGWGFPYYNAIFDVLKTKDKYRDEMGNQEDTTEPSDWPSGHNQLLTPPKKNLDPMQEALEAGEK